MPKILLRQGNGDGVMDYSEIKRKRLLITVILLVISLLLTLYFHFILGIGIVFTHFFYIPIMMVSIWWGYWGVLVAAALGAMICIPHLLADPYNFTEDLFRTFFFISVAFLTGSISASEKTAVCNLIESGKVMQVRENVIHLMTHQLLSPLTALRWILTTLLEDKGKDITSGQKDEFLSRANALVNKMIFLMKDFLYLSRIEGGKLKYSPVFTDLAALAEKAIAENKRIINEKRQKVYFEKTETNKVNIDPEIASQIIQRLFLNAIQYTPSGGEIKISFSASGEDVSFKISDSGYGIPKNEQDNVFKQFFRGTNVIKIVPDGTGLGLSIVEKLIRISGGRIWFQSKENKGTTFYVTLPAINKQL